MMTKYGITGSASVALAARLLASSSVELDAAQLPVTDNFSRTPAVWSNQSQNAAPRLLSSTTNNAVASLLAPLNAQSALSGSNASNSQYIVLSEAQFSELLRGATPAPTKSEIKEGFALKDQTVPAVYIGAGLFLAWLMKRGLHLNEVEVISPMLQTDAGRGLRYAADPIVRSPIGDVLYHYLPLLGPLTEAASPENLAMRLAQLSSWESSGFAALSDSDKARGLGALLVKHIRSTVSWRGEVQYHAVASRLQLAEHIQRTEGVPVDEEFYTFCHRFSAHVNCNVAPEHRAGFHRRHMTIVVSVTPHAEILNQLLEPYKYFCAAANNTSREQRLAGLFGFIRELEFAAAFVSQRMDFGVENMLEKYPLLNTGVRSAADYFSPMLYLPKEQSLLYLVVSIMSISIGRGLPSAAKADEIVKAWCSVAHTRAAKLVEQPGLAELSRQVKLDQILQHAFNYALDATKGIDISKLPALGPLNGCSIEEFKALWQVKLSRLAGVTKKLQFPARDKLNDAWFYCAFALEPQQPNNWINSSTQNMRAPTPMYEGAPVPPIFVTRSGRLAAGQEA